MCCLLVGGAEVQKIVDPTLVCGPLVDTGLESSGRQGWVQGFEYMSPMLRLLSIFWLLSEHWFHSSAGFLHEASCSLQAIFLTAHVLNQYMILSPLASPSKIREISALFASHSHP